MQTLWYTCNIKEAKQSLSVAMEVVQNLVYLLAVPLQLFIAPFPVMELIFAMLISAVVGLLHFWVVSYLRSKGVAVNIAHHLFLLVALQLCWRIEPYYHMQSFPYFKYSYISADS